MSIGSSTAASLPTYGTAWVAPTLPNWRTEETKDGSNRYPWEYDTNATDMIDKYRKGDCRITVVSAANTPISGASVSAQMQEHAFIWGTNVESANAIDVPAYLAKITDGTWNGFVLDRSLKQGFWDGSYDVNNFHGGVKTGKSFALPLIETLRATGKFREQRGHVLNYPQDPPYFPSDLYGSTKASRRAYWRDTHLPDKTSSTVNTVHIWELTNEIVHNPHYEVTSGERWKDPDYIADSQLALTLSAGRPLYINEWDGNQLSNHVQHAEYLIAQGIPIAAVAWQGRMSGAQSYNSYAQKFAELNKATGGGAAPWDMLITEFEVQSADATTQGTNETNGITAAFANPACLSFSNWGIWDGSPTQWIPDSGYYAADWSPKPRMTSFNALVHGAWKTSSSGSTNGSGYHQFRGTFGAYDLTVTSGPTTVTRSFELHPGMREIVIVIP